MKTSSSRLLTSVTTAFQHLAPSEHRLPMNTELWMKAAHCVLCTLWLVGIVALYEAAVVHTHSFDVADVANGRLFRLDASHHGHDQ
jgi:hypothetical protein